MKDKSKAANVTQFQDRNGPTSVMVHVEYVLVAHPSIQERAIKRTQIFFLFFFFWKWHISQHRKTKSGSNFGAKTVNTLQT